jgi:hypothetical protein
MDSWTQCASIVCTEQNTTAYKHKIHDLDVNDQPKGLSNTVILDTETGQPYRQTDSAQAVYGHDNT